LRGPFAGALLLGFIEHQVYHGLPGLGIGPAEDIGCDLDQVRLELALVPFAENLGQLGVAQTQAALEQVVGLSNQLHVAILDAVVHHLDVVPGAAWANVDHARLAIDLGGNGLEDGFDQLPCLGLTTGHDGGAPQSSLLAAADPGSDVDDAQGLQLD
jgi:hypothetical protein